MSNDTHLTRPYRPVQKKSSGDGIGWMISIFLLTAVPLIIFDGWMLSVMWNWFVPSIFVGIPLLTIGEALGLSVVISAFTYNKNDNDDMSTWGALFAALFNPILRGLSLLGIGAIIHAIAF